MDYPQTDHGLSVCVCIYVVLLFTSSIESLALVLGVV